MHSPKPIRIGCAGWTIPGPEKDSFGSGPSHLARYATRFSAVEINSSFYRPHRPTTYARWAAATPAKFRFAVKVPRSITHEMQLQNAEAEFAAFLDGPLSLGSKLGVLLVQLPPSARFDAPTAERFFRAAREVTAVPIACEPRHRTWFEHDATELLRRGAITRVAADPACVPAATEPDADLSLVYFRLHGSPKTYYSAYDDDYLKRLATRLRELHATGCETWCIFDNTALGAATTNGLELERLTGLPPYDDG